ncbi:MAG: hypothetical protein GKS02_11905 [Alphaproteobacteria bacterium]|nr:hypothetical protein [Alphaproteobacteria bacterium]
MTDAGAQIPAVVEIDHSFFKAFDNAHFRMSAPPDEKPVFSAMLGEQEVALPLTGIIRELSLEEGDPLRIMVETIGKSLKFVSVLRAGDEVPAEVRTGEASWESGADHLEIASQRLTMQLVTWVSGRETMITDPLELQQLLEDPSTKDKVNEAFKEAADKLGLDDPDEVTTMVESFAEELAYVEALRSRFSHIRALFKSLTVLRQSYRDQNSVIDEIDPVVRLMKKPVADFQTKFDLADAQTGEIMSVLSKLDVQRDYIRDMRDELFARFEAWQPIVDQWHGVNPLDPPQGFNVGNALRDLYQFLAQRYLEADEWILMTSPKNSENGEMRYGGVMTW